MSETGSGGGESKRTDGAAAMKIFWAVAGIILLFLVNRVAGPSPTGRAMQNAQMLLWEGHYDQALTAFGAMIKESPTWYWPYNGRGETYRRMGDLDHAFADLNEAIRLKPDYYEAYFSRCQAFRTKGDIDRAIGDCEESARIKPEWEPQQTVAILLFEKGEFDRAGEKLGQLIELRPDSMEPRFYRGQIALFRRNQPAEAAEDFAKAAAAAFDYRTVGEMFGPQEVDGKRVADLMAPGHAFMPDAVYLLVWNHLARFRAGQDDAKELADHLEQLGKPIWRELVFDKFENVTNEVVQKSLAPWPGPIFRLYLGRGSPQGVRAAAEGTADPDERRRRTCDADFYVAEYNLEKGAVDDARRLLRNAAEACPSAARERAFAEAELTRLGAN